MAWYEAARRPMPWKEIKDPYLIWLSEIILQQTRVEQGLAYFNKFKSAYPTVHDLAAAPDTAVMKHWEGLGYYSRARNLLKTARLVSTTMNGVFPDNAAALLKLPGIGPYTAAAIASFAYNEPIPVIDGNVYRVLSRYMDEATPIDTTTGKKQFAQLAQLAFDPSQPARYNQAIMDFGALVCKPKQADCAHCPVNTKCIALANGSVYKLPVKSKKLVKKTRYFHFLVAKNKSGEYLVQQRQAADIWRELYQFPLLETEQEGQSLAQLWPTVAQDFPLEASNFVVHKIHPPRKQQLTHQTIISYFYEGACNTPLDLPESYAWVNDSELNSLAFPKVIASFIEEKAVFLDLFTSLPKK